MTPGIRAQAVLAAALCFLAPRAADAAALKNASFEQDERGLVHVRYRLEDPDGSGVEIQLRLSADRGRTFTLIPKALSGDTGRVSGSGEKEAIWDVEKDYPDLSGTGFVFAVEGISAAEAAAKARAQAQAQSAAAAKAAGAASARRSGIEWISIPGGSFRMGSEDVDDAKPVRRVRVKPFEMAKTSVTNKQYKACVDAGSCTPAHAADGTCLFVGPVMRGPLPASFQGDDQPVVCVTWDQAKAFSEWAGGRLPSESEREYAARSAGKDWEFPGGTGGGTCAKAVIDEGGFGCGRAATWPVCSKPAGNTRQGLCDMAGNVSEWVQDWYHESYEGAPGAGSWERPASKSRVSRGGSWRDDAFSARVFDRGYAPPGKSFATIGFRPVR